MELMFIVWLVSIFSTIKDFVSSYTPFVVAALFVVFVLHRINKSLLEPRGSASELRDGLRITNKDICLGDGTLIPKGTRLQLDMYSEYGYITSDSLNIYRIRLTREEIYEAYRPSTDGNAPPLLPAPVYKPTTYLLYLMIALNIFLPSDTTMKYMAGAYLLQSTYQTEFVQKAIPLSQKAVLNQLNRWAEDSTELKNLLLENQNEGAKGN